MPAMKPLTVSSIGYSYSSHQEVHDLTCTVNRMSSGEHTIALKITNFERGPTVFLDRKGALELMLWLTKAFAKTWAMKKL